MKFVFLLALAACQPHHELELVPHARGAIAPGISTVKIESHCGLELKPDAPLPWWAPAPEASNLRELGCPYHDGEAAYYVVDLALRSSGYQVESWKADATDGVVSLYVMEYKHCEFICKDISAVVTLTLTDAKTGQELWKTACDARSTEKSAHDLVPDATTCAADKLSALARR